MPGTYHFYRQDYKLNGLWASPQKLINSGCSQVVEPNFSTNDNMPTAVGVWAIYRKRWLTRYWQHYGIRTFVDLYVSTKFEAINLFGVPRGWQSYCTRVTSSNWEHAIHDYEIATEHANGKPVLFVVYGGDRRMEQVCKDHGWVWLAEQMYVKEGRIHG